MGLYVWGFIYIRVCIIISKEGLVNSMWWGVINIHIQEKEYPMTYTGNTCTEL